ncbi:MAG: hypothetical protein GY861_29215, partial [bacterium]|nr:hypothetical protein [bacterium]
NIPKATYWLTCDALQCFIQPKSEDSGSLSKERGFKDQPRDHTKPHERTKSEERKTTSGWTQKARKDSHITYPGEKSPDFDKHMSGNDFPDSKSFKSSVADLESVEILDSDISLLELELDQGRYLAKTPSKSPGLSEFEPKPNQGLHLAKTPSKSPGTMNPNIDIEN